MGWPLLAVAPGLDVPIDLLVKARDRSATYPRAPQRFGDLFDPAHRYSREIRLHQCLLDGGLTPFIPLHNRGLKPQPPQLRYPQRHFSGLGFKLAFVMAGSAIYTLC